MDFEQKYKEALERAKSKIKNDKDRVLYESDVIDIFPELYESEDEMIRKVIIEHFAGSHSSMFPYKGFTKEQILAWLEKQDKQNTNILWHDASEEPEKYREVLCEWRAKGDINHLTSFHDVAFYHRNDKTFWNGKQQIENVIKWAYVDEMPEKQDEQKSQDKSALEAIKEEKVEPKFKVSKWYQCTKDFFGKGVTFDKNTAYYCAKEGCLQDEYGCHIAIVKDLYDNFKLWTIEDAKNGDVLAWDDSKCIALFKNIYDEESFNSHGYVGHCTGTFKSRLTYHVIEDAHPATKEQRDLLFAKMHEAGYEWDAEKKELKSK